MSFGGAGPFAIVLVAGFTANYALHMINLTLQREGLPAGFVSASTAVQAVGIVLGALASVRTLDAMGSAGSVKLGGVIAGLALSAGWALETPAAIAVLRLIFGIGAGLIVTNLEYVILARAPGGRRGMALAVYATLLAVGSAGAPLAAAALAPNPFAAFGFGAALMFAISALVHLANIRGARPAPAQSRPSLGTLRLAPLAFVAALLFGGLETGLLSLVAVFGVDAGLTEIEASCLATAGFLGVVFWQIPAGCLSDRFNPRSLMVGTSLTGALCLAGLFSVSGAPQLFLMFLLGGCCDTFYILGLAMLGRSVDSRQLAAGNACFVATCGLGEILGPVLGGLAAFSAGPKGVFLAFACPLLVFVVLLMLRSDRQAGGEQICRKRGAPLRLNPLGGR